MLYLLANWYINLIRQKYVENMFLMTIVYGYVRILLVLSYIHYILRVSAQQ